MYQVYHFTDLLNFISKNNFLHKKLKILGLLEENSSINKKVLLHKHKRHTGRHVAIAISCYPQVGGGRGPLTKIFLPQPEHVSSQIWSQNFFPLLGGGSLDRNFFSQSEHVSSQIWCQKFFPLLVGGGPSTNFFFPF